MYFVYNYTFYSSSFILLSMTQNPNLSNHQIKIPADSTHQQTKNQQHLISGHLQNNDSIVNKKQNHIPSLHVQSKTLQKQQQLQKPIKNQTETQRESGQQENQKQKPQKAAHPKIQNENKVQTSTNKLEPTVHNQQTGKSQHELAQELHNPSISQMPNNQLKSTESKPIQNQHNSKKQQKKQKSKAEIANQSLKKEQLKPSFYKQSLTQIQSKQHLNKGIMHQQKKFIDNDHNNIDDSFQKVKQNAEKEIKTKLNQTIKPQKQQPGKNSQQKIHVQQKTNQQKSIEKPIEKSIQIASKTKINAEKKTQKQPNLNLSQQHATIKQLCQLFLTKIKSQKKLSKINDINFTLELDPLKMTNSQKNYTKIKFQIALLSSPQNKLPSSPQNKLSSEVKQQIQIGKSQQNRQEQAKQQQTQELRTKIPSLNSLRFSFILYNLTSKQNSKQKDEQLTEKEKKGLEFQKKLEAAFHQLNKNNQYEIKIKYQTNQAQSKVQDNSPQESQEIKKRKVLGICKITLIVKQQNFDKFCQAFNITKANIQALKAQLKESKDQGNLSSVKSIDRMPPSKQQQIYHQKNLTDQNIKGNFQSIHHQKQNKQDIKADRASHQFSSSIQLGLYMGLNNVQQVLNKKLIQQILSGFKLQFITKRTKKQMSKECLKVSSLLHQTVLNILPLNLANYFNVIKEGNLFIKFKSLNDITKFLTKMGIKDMIDQTPTLSQVLRELFEQNLKGLFGESAQRSKQTHQQKKKKTQSQFQLFKFISTVISQAHYQGLQWETTLFKRLSLKITLETNSQNISEIFKKVVSK